MAASMLGKSRQICLSETTSWLSNAHIGIVVFCICVTSPICRVASLHGYIMCKLCNEQIASKHIALANHHLLNDVLIILYDKK